MDRATGSEDAHRELARVLLGPQPLGQLLDRVAGLARTAVPGIDEVSVTVVDEGRPRSVAFTGDLAVALDERQYETGFGPCLHAAAHGRVVAVPDTATERRYPDFARLAHRSGVTRSVSVGMPVPGRVVGALNLYGRSGQGFEEDTVALAQRFADHAGVTLANAALYARTAEQVEQMRAAMASRAVIEQAKGILMALRGCSPDEAFAELSRLSARENRKVRDLAADVVAQRGHGF